MNLTSLRSALTLLVAAPLTAATPSPQPAHVTMTRPQEALATHLTNYGHTSTFVELEGGRILQCSGTTLSTSDDGGLTWSKQYLGADPKGAKVGGSCASLVRLNGSAIGLAALVQDSTTPEVEERFWNNRLVFWRSADGGRTWSEPTRLSPPGLPTFALQDVFLRTASGRIVLPVYTAFGQKIGPDNQAIPYEGRLVRNQWVGTGAHFRDARFLASFVLYSDDDGRTWRRNKDELLYIMHDWSTHFDRAGEPSVAEVAPGRLLMIMRTALGRLYESWSKDNGETWTRPTPTALAATETPAQIRRLPTGHLLMVWNQESEDEVKRGYNRTRVSAAISRNGGSVWEFFQNLSSLLPGARVEPGPIRAVRPAQHHFAPGTPAPVREPDELGDSEVWVRSSYPSVLVLKDRVLVTHTYSRFEEDAAIAQMKNPESFNQVQRVLPLTWFYGGKKPAENPTLQKIQAQAAAKP